MGTRLMMKGNDEGDDEGMRKEKTKEPKFLGQGEGIKSRQAIAIS